MGPVGKLSIDFQSDRFSLFMSINKIYVAYCMCPAFLFRPSIFSNIKKK